MQASGGQSKKRLNSKTFPREAPTCSPVNTEFKLYWHRNLMGEKISGYCMGFKKQPHLITFLVTTAMRFLVLELDLSESSGIDSGG